MQQTNGQAVAAEMATTPTKKREVVRFTPNVPVEVALKFAGQGQIISTRLGERVMYTLADERVMFLDLAVAQQINALGVNVREKFFICKHSGTGKGADWTVWLSSETEAARAAAETGKREAFGEIGDGTFVVPVGREVEVLAPGNDEVEVKTVEPNGHAAAGASTPATAQVVTNDHSSNDEFSRHRCPAITELTKQTPEISRFMPVMDIGQALQRRQAIVDATQKLMRPGVDFGRVAGTDRDVLLQPGADKLCNLFGLVVHYEVTKSEEDWTGEKHGGTPFFFYEVRGCAYRGDFLMGEGIGSCSSWESKYRWRKAERICPNCGKANIRKSNREEGWYCWTKTEGCGAKFPIGDPVIEAQETGRKANPDMADVVNTILKMAYKRAKVSTTINATSASEFFTQDLEETPPVERNLPDYRKGAASAPNATVDQGQALIPETSQPVWTNRGEMRRMFDVVRERVGETLYLAELDRFGVRTPDDFRNDSAARSCYRRLVDLAKEVA